MQRKQCRTAVNTQRKGTEISSALDKNAFAE